MWTNIDQSVNQTTTTKKSNIKWGKAIYRHTDHHIYYQIYNLKAFPKRFSHYIPCLSQVRIDQVDLSSLVIGLFYGHLDDNGKQPKVCSVYFIFFAFTASL